MAVTEEESSSSSTNMSSNQKTRPSSSSTAAAAALSNGVHYLARTALKSSVVLQVLHGRIRSPFSYDLIFGKETSIELVAIADDGVVQSICEQPVFGIIKDLAVLRWNERFRDHSSKMLGKDLLVALSDSGKVSILYFSNEMHRFFPANHVQLSDPGNARHQIGRMIAVDPLGCYIAVSAFEGRLALLSVSATSNLHLIDKQIIYPSEPDDNLVGRESQEACPSAASTSSDMVETAVVESDSTPPILPHSIGTIWSMCFMSRNSMQLWRDYNPLLAILANRKGSSENELVLLEWDVREGTARVVSQFRESGPLAHMISEVPGSYGLAILFRIGDILLMDLSDSSNPFCVQTIGFTASVPVNEEQNCSEEPSRIHDGDDEGFIAARALLELQDYGMDFGKSDDPMSTDCDNYNEKIVSRYVCSWSWEPGSGANPRIIISLDTGEFFLIEVASSADGPRIILSDCLYDGLSCKALLWTEVGFLAAIVEMGDGLVLKLEEGRLHYSSPIQNIAPILDMSVMDYHNEKYDQMFACCGMAPDGSLRIIRSGISVERLLRTAPIYQGVTAIWTVKMKKDDSFHSFLVLSFVEETRVLSVGVSFSDVTDSVGFEPGVCTLACGLVDNCLLVQIHQDSVRLCLPTAAAHSEGIPLSSPTCTSWSPDHIGISLGSVGHNLIVVATSNPGFLIILGIKMLSLHHYELYEMQHIKLLSELSCISVPQNRITRTESASPSTGADNGYMFVIGTHIPSVEILSYSSDHGITVLATGTISLTNTSGTAISGCIPQDVRLVLVERLYVLSGLRNGMLLRFEWPTASWAYELPCQSPPRFTKSGLSKTSSVVGLQSAVMNFHNDNDPDHLLLIAVRRIGITPVFLVPLGDSLDEDVIALSDRPWLVQAARHSLSYMSISFQPSTCVTPVCSAECPKGLLFVSENSLHLVEMVQSKRLNVQKFHLGGTPRKVLYHSDSRLLLVLRTDLDNDSFSSDVCCLDPLTGSVISSFKFDVGETGKSMELVRVGSEQVVVVGTSLSSGPAIMSTGEAESTKGRLIVLCLEHSQHSDTASMTICSKVGSSSLRTSSFDESGNSVDHVWNSSRCSSPDDNSCDGVKLDEAEAWQLRLTYATTWPGVVLAICPYLDHYFLASSSNAFYVCGFPNDNPQRVRRFAAERTRFVIVSLSAYFTRIAVGDCRDGVLLYSYHEDSRKLEQIYCDPSQRLVADCLLTDIDTAIVSDRKGTIAVLTSLSHFEDDVSPECNLKVCFSYYMGEIAMSIRKGSFSYKLPVEDAFKESGDENQIDMSHHAIMAGTLLGSIVIFIRLSREEYELLKSVQAKLAVHPLTAPILGNDHSEFRSRENQSGATTILDGDMLAQFLELTSIQQESILDLPCATSEASSSYRSPYLQVSVNQVVQILERIHYALN